MTAAFDYGTFVMRNSGYIDVATQDKIRNTKLLIAGCGIGSGPAICAARMGFENFILVDGDVVDAHNLNRQFYDFDDVDTPKVEALKKQILRINPNAKVEAIKAYLDADNTDSIIGKSDIVFDTVDFLDLQAILRLHTSAKAQNKEIFTALSVGFGALVWYFPASSPLSLANLIAPDVERVAAASEGHAPSYVDVFAAFIGRLVPYLDKEVVEQITEVLTRMKDGKPCPASQLAIGSFSIGAMAVSMMHDLLSGRPVVSAPSLVLHSFKRHLSQVVDITA